MATKAHRSTRPPTARHLPGRLPLAEDGSLPAVFPLDPPASPASVSRCLVKDVGRLNRLRVSADRREEIIATLVRGMKRVAPGFATRRMRWADVVQACRRERVLIEWGDGRSDSELLRYRTGPPSAGIRLARYLSPQAAVFCAFTELAHWLGHPMGWTDAVRLGVDGFMHQEACTLGYLALFPHPVGRPYPIFQDAERLEAERGAHYRLTVWQPTRPPRRDPRRPALMGAVTWRTRRTDVLWYPQLPLPADRPWFADGGAWG